MNLNSLFESLFSGSREASDTSKLTPPGTPKTYWEWQRHFAQYTSIADRHLYKSLENAATQDRSVQLRQLKSLLQEPNIQLCESLVANAKDFYAERFASEVGIPVADVKSLLFGPRRESSIEFLTSLSEGHIKAGEATAYFRNHEEFYLKIKTFKKSHGQQVKAYCLTDVHSEIFQQTLNETLKFQEAQQQETAMAMGAFTGAVRDCLAHICHVEDTEQIIDQFIFLPEVQGAAKNPVKIRTFLKMWHEKMIQDIGEVDEGVMLAMLGISASLSIANQAKDRSLLEYAQQVFNGDDILLETLWYVSPPDAPRLNYLPHVKGLLSAFDQTPEYGAHVALLARIPPSKRLEILEEVASSDTAREFLLSSLPASQPFEHSGSPLTEKVQFWLDWGNENWGHDNDRSVIHTLLAKGGRHGAIDCSRLAQLMPAMLQHPSSADLENVLGTKRFALDLLETYFSFDEPAAASFFLEVVMDGQPNLKQETILKKWKEIPDDDLQSLINLENDRVKQFWSYKKPKDNVAPQTGHLERKKTALPAPSNNLKANIQASVAKGSRWIDSLKDRMPDFIEDIELIEKLLPGGEAVLKTMEKTFQAEEAIRISLELASMQDAYPELAKVILGSHAYKKGFGEFVLRVTTVELDDFKQGSKHVKNLPGWVSQHLSEANGHSKPRQPSAYSRVRHELKDQVQVIQFISETLGQVFLEEHQKTAGANRIGAMEVYFYNPLLGGDLYQGDKKTVICIDENWINGMSEFNLDAQLIIPLEEPTIGDISSIRAAIAEQSAALTEQAFLVNERIQIPSTVEKNILGAWSKLDPIHQKTFARYFAQLVDNGSCGTMKVYTTRSAGIGLLSVRIVSAGGPRAYFLKGKGEFEGTYKLVCIGDKGSQEADLKLLDKLDVQHVFEQPSSPFSLLQSEND